MRARYFERAIVQSIIFALFLFFLFFILKLFFVLYIGAYHGAIGDVKSSGEYVQTFINGLRYDARNIAVLSIVYLVIALMFSRARSYSFVLWVYTVIIVAFTIFINVAEIVFYQIFDDAFNANLLGLLFDDQKAIFHTGISGQYSIIGKVIIWLGLSFIFIWSYTKIFRFNNRRYELDYLSFRMSNNGENLIFSIVLFVVFGLFMMLCINSRFGFTQVSLDQAIKPVENSFLRKITPGSYRNLYLVYRGYTRIKNSHFSDYINQSPLEVVREYFGLDSTQTHYDLRDLLAQEVSNTEGTNIEHIFYIVAESLSEWHFSDEFDEIELTAGLKSLLDGGHGIKIGRFFQSAGSTIKSMDVQLTGLLQTEIPINTMASVLQPFVTSPGAIMKDLGYSNNFYYGGSGIWQKLDQYSVSQGFDNIYYNMHIVNNAKINDYPVPYEGLWGAYDHHLFSFIRDNVFAQRSKPSFNMILTTSNHPPYDVPLEQFGIKFDKIEKFFATHTQYKDKNLKLIGHIWYQDKIITRFIQEVSNVLPNSLFIITGDHYDREYLKGTSVLVSNSVPLIFYSPILNIKKHTNFGSHIDITPSIVELVAPHKYVYHSFGTPLVGNDNRSLGSKQGAFGYFAIATDRFIYNQYGEMEYFGLARNNDKELAKSLYKRLQQATALSWWILKNGYEVQEEDVNG